MSGLIFSQRVVAESPAVEHAGREALGDDVGHRDQALARSRGPSGCRTLSEIPRLPGFLLLNCPPMSGSVTPGSGPVAASRAARPPTGAIAARRVSGWLFHSTLMLSAPNAARNRVPPAEARNHVKSRMRMPCSGNGLPRGDGGSSRIGARARRRSPARRARRRHRPPRRPR